MKNSKLAKLVLVILMVVMVTCIGVDVFAADGNSSYDDLQAVLNKTGNNTTNNVASNTANNTVNKTANNTVNNTAKNNTLSTSAITTNTANNATTTSLPKTGIASSTSVIVLITICGISAIYAYNKIKDYKNL